MEQGIERGRKGRTRGKASVNQPAFLAEAGDMPRSTLLPGAKSHRDLGAQKVEITLHQKGKKG